MISRITDQVAIGDADDSRIIQNKDFDATLNVAVDLDILDGFKWRHKVGLLDGPGNHPSTFLAAVLLLDSLVMNGKRVLVHCQAGTSRSVMVVATWIASKGLTSLDDALNQIMALRKVDQYRPNLYALAVSAIPLLKSVYANTNTQTERYT